MLASLAALTLSLPAALPSSPASTTRAARAARPASQDEEAGGSPIADLLKKHPLISRLDYEMEDAERAGFVLHIQLPRDESPGHVKTVSRIYGRAFGSMGENMRRMLLDSVGAGDDLVQYVFVCSSEAALINARRFGNPEGRNIEFATTLPDVRMVVTYIGVEGEEDQRALFAALHEGAYRLLERARTVIDPIQDLWLFEGLSTYFANSGSRHLAPGITPSPDRTALETMRTILADEASAKALLLTTTGLLECQEERRLRGAYLRQASDAGVAYPSEEQSVAAFRAHSALLVHFLFHAEGARYRDGFRDYAKLALENKGGPEALAESLDMDLGALDEAFRAFAERLVAGASSDSLSEEMTRALGAEGANHPSVLPQPVDGDEWLAFSIGCARLGDLDAALLGLEVGAESASGDVQARMEREKTRLEALRSARDAYLQSIVGSKTRLRMKLDGEALSAPVESIEDGVVHLGKSKSDVESVELRQILPADIAENIERNATDYGPAWVPCYAKLLADDSRWDKDLDVSDPDAQALADDAKASLDELVAAGDAMARLADLARSPRPESVESAKALNASITSLFEDCGELDVVRAKFEALRNLSLQAWQKVYEEEGLAQLLNGEVEMLDDGRMRIAYDFDDEDQLKDFKDRTGYLADHKSFEGKSPDDSSLEIKKKVARGDGFLCYEHVLGFEAPMTVKYEIKYDKTKKKNKDAQSTFILGICDDGAESYVIAYNMFDLEAVDKKNHHTATAFAEGDRKIDVKKSHKLELVHDGESTVTLEHNGKEVRTIDVGERRAGSVFFWMNTQVPISLVELEIEGKVIETVLSRMQNEWVAEQLEGMGFGG